MLRYLILSIAFPSLAFAHHHKCDHAHYGDGKIKWLCDGEGLGQTSPPNSIFTMAGKICSGPKFDSDGDLIMSYRFYAEELADKGAEKRCFPFQTHRETDYRYEALNADCSLTNPHAVKETVTAEYSCAQTN